MPKLYVVFLLIYIVLFFASQHFLFLFLIVFGVIFITTIVLLLASIRKIFVAFQSERKIDTIAILGLFTGVIVLGCFTLTLLGPVLDSR